MAEKDQSTLIAMKQETVNPTSDLPPSSTDTNMDHAGSLDFGNVNGNSRLAPSSLSPDTPEFTNLLQWDAFTAFHWGPSTSTGMDDRMNTATMEAAPTATTTTVITSTSTINNSVLSVPMLPGVPSEPMYRQHRSLSFSMGQDPSIFGYDYYNDDMNDTGINNNSGRHGYRSSLATMAEEEDGHDDTGRDLWFGVDSSLNFERRQRHMSFDTIGGSNGVHMRSHSSGATFGVPHRNITLGDTCYQQQLLAAYQQQQQIMPNSTMHHRSSPDQWEDVLQTSRRRRSSLASLWNQDSDLFSSGATSSTLETQQQTHIPPSPTTPYPMPSPLYHTKDSHPATGTMDQQDHFSQRRLSQVMDYSFPDNNQSYFPLADTHQRRKSCTSAPGGRRPLQHGYSSSLLGLTNQLETIHLQSEPSSPLPCSSFSTPHMRPHDHQTQQQYNQSSENGHSLQQHHTLQQHMYYQQQPTPPIPHPLSYAMHPYQQMQEGMVFHYGLPSTVLPPKPMYSRQQQPHHYIQQDEHHQQHVMNHQYSSALDEQSMTNNLETTNLSLGQPPQPTYSMVAASNGSGIKNHDDPRMYHENGKGVPLHRFPAHGPLYMVEFKAGRIDFYYLSMVGSEPMVGDLVIVEADRGKDLGKVANVGVTCKKAMDILQAVVPDELDPSLSSSSTCSSSPEDDTKQQTIQKPQDPVYVKRIHRLATPDEINMLLIKSQDEQRALVICQQKIKQRKLQMEVVDAEYQWDRRKMTFYFNAERRIDFRELVRDLFKVYKTRIWMCAVSNKRTNTIMD